MMLTADMMMEHAERRSKSSALTLLTSFKRLRGCRRCMRDKWHEAAGKVSQWFGGRTVIAEDECQEGPGAVPPVNH